MHLVSRILFWLGLAGTTLALIAPTLFGGASWGEAQVAVFLGMLFTFVFGGLSIATTPLGPQRDMFERAARRRRGAIVYTLLTAGALGVAGLVAYERAESDMDANSLDGTSSLSQSYRLAELDDAAKGTWSGAIGMGAAGVAFFAFIVFAASKPARPVSQAYGANGHGAWSPNGAWQGAAHGSYAPAPSYPQPYAYPPAHAHAPYPPPAGAPSSYPPPSSCPAPSNAPSSWPPPANPYAAMQAGPPNAYATTALALPPAQLPAMDAPPGGLRS